MYFHTEIYIKISQIYRLQKNKNHLSKKHNSLIARTVEKLDNKLNRKNYQISYKTQDHPLSFSTVGSLISYIKRTSS